MSRARPSPEARDSGAAIVEYTLVATLLIFVFLGIAQVALVLHARNVLVADAAEGARAAAVRGAGLDDGEQVCADSIRHSLSSAAAAGSPCSAALDDEHGAQLVDMRAQVTLPLTFVPLGKIHLDVRARALREPQ